MTPRFFLLRNIYFTEIFSFMCLLDALCVCRNRVVTLYAVNNNKKGQTYPVVLIIFLFEKVVVKKKQTILWHYSFRPNPFSTIPPSCARPRGEQVPADGKTGLSPRCAPPYLLARLLLQYSRSSARASF